MQQTCRNCNRTFNINDNAISSYKATQQRVRDLEIMASQVQLNSINYKWGTELYKLGEQKYWELKSEAEYLNGTIINPYICPYCGKDSRENYLSSNNTITISSSNESGYYELFDGFDIFMYVICIIWGLFFQTGIPYTSYDYKGILYIVAWGPLALKVIWLCWQLLHNWEYAKDEKQKDEERRKREEEEKRKKEEEKIKLEQIKKIVEKFPDKEYITDGGIIKFKLILSENEIYIIDNKTHRKKILSCDDRKLKYFNAVEKEIGLTTDKN